MDAVQVKPIENWEVDSWFLVSRTDLVLAITFMYLAFVLKLGPALMRDRKPFSLKNTIIIYNCGLVAFSTWWLYKVIFEVGVIQHLACMKTNPPDKYNYAVNSMFWYFLLSKLFEFFDTIFFILRKKQNQISFLHVFHHSFTFLFMWAVLKYFKDNNLMVYCFINDFVHVVMYSYYTLAALGPKYKRFLWIKPYITWMQIAQFVFLAGYSLFSLKCKTSRTPSYISLAGACTFLVLFTNFYYQTFIKPKKALK